ncbi:MAG TPA: hypothetical protein VIO81_04525, partial [Methyloversatilis sp.]
MYTVQSKSASSAVVACCIATCLAAGLPRAYAAPVTLGGDPVDYGYESAKVCCVDVAAVNLLYYLDRFDETRDLVPDGTTVGAQQESFHKKYDPGFTKLTASEADLKKGLNDTFRERNFSADVKIFLQPKLSYETLLKEWREDELIILLGTEVTQGWGHAFFLWGLDDDKTTPRVGVVDPNFHPNTHHMIDGKDTNSTGAAFWSDVQIGLDAQQLPDWRIKLDQPAYTYRVGDVEEEMDAKTNRFRITGFVSVSDVNRIPEPGVLALCGIGFAAVLLAGARNGGQRDRTG